jgi:hypothetical protein
VLAAKASPVNDTCLEPRTKEFRVTDPHEPEAAHYEVPASSAVAPTAAAPTRRRPAAILVAHGMGQQIPFQTLDDVADGLCKAAPAGRRAPRAETVAIGSERLQRLDLSIELDDGSERDVHVYEAYWAPLTEGRVTLRDVMAFLIRGSVAGIRAGRKPFRRWLFGDYVRFPAPVRSVIYLELGLAIVASLTILNTMILAVAAARVPLHDVPRWATDAFVHDMTTVLNALICALAPFGAVLGWAELERRAKRVVRFRRLSVVTFVVALWATMAAAILVLAAVVYHTVPERQPPSFFDATPWAAAIRAFDHQFDRVVSFVLASGAVATLLLRLARTHDELADDLPQNQTTRRLTRRVRLLFLAIAGTLALFAEEVLRRGNLLGVVLASWHGLSWPLVIAVTLLVRWFLIEYVGDVAAYVQPQVLDRFFELRSDIKEWVWRAARAVYSDAQYGDILLVGHSLGSVVMYDTLNRLILDRQLDPHAPEVSSRTRLLLTFGSPLDKTAFVFGIQGTGSEAREALAASVQPLLTQSAARPAWVNIWSPWDIISGALDYYDLPRKTNPKPVQNVKDPDATTLLAAHVEYWNNPLLYKTILEHLG